MNENETMFSPGCGIELNHNDTIFASEGDDI